MALIRISQTQINISDRKWDQRKYLINIESVLDFDFFISSSLNTDCLSLFHVNVSPLALVCPLVLLVDGNSV